jgi:hypothetical protein
VETHLLVIARGKADVLGEGLAWVVLVEMMITMAQTLGTVMIV